MLDVRHSIPMADLLSHPTVLELERAVNINNDDEMKGIPTPSPSGGRGWGEGEN